MAEPRETSEEMTGRDVAARPVITPAEAHADRIERARRLAGSSVLLAMVASPEISADLIDEAIALTVGAG